MIEIVARRNVWIDMAAVIWERTFNIARNTYRRPHLHEIPFKRCD